MTNPYEWLRMIGANESLREIASKTGVSHATLSRQINDGAFLMDTTIRLARAYAVSPVAALVANGHLTEAEAGLDAIDSALQLASDGQLVAAVADRLGVDLSIFDKPISQAFTDAANVTEIRRSVPAPKQTDRAVAKKKSRDPGGDEGDF